MGAGLGIGALVFLLAGADPLEAYAVIWRGAFGNRFLLTEGETGELTPRGQRIIDHTPMNRFGDPEDLLGTVLWLLSPASAFVTGVVVPVDGGFSAFSGV